MSGNSTLAILRAYVRTMLNDPNKKMWSDAALNSYLKRAFDIYYERYNMKNQAAGYDNLSVTFPASTVFYDLSGASAPNIVEIVSVNDVTNTSNPSILVRASPEEIYRILERFPSGGDPTHYGFVTTESVAAGVITVVQQLLIAPTPSSSRSLTILLQMGALSTQFISDTHTTGMPEPVEQCMVLKAQILARLQEENPNVTGLQTELTKAEKDMKIYATELYGPVDSVGYDPSWTE